MARDDRNHPVDAGLADRGRDVGAADPDPVALGEEDGLLPRQLRQPLRVAEVEPALHREPRERSVHRAGVEVAEAKPLGERSCHCALARSCGPVDCHDHRYRLVTDSRSS